MNRQRICYASEEMIPALQKMWQVCFGDDMDYISFYFAHRFTNHNMMVYCVNDQPVSMISLLPATLHINGESNVDNSNQYPVRYVYAVATLPTYRRNGYARALIETAYRDLEEALILEPATRELAAYYEKMGFVSAFYVMEQTYSTKEIKAAASEDHGQVYWLLTITPAEYARMRNQILGKQILAARTCNHELAGYVEWDEDAIAYALLENDYGDGYAYKISHHGVEDILLFREEEEHIRVIETSLREPDLLAVMKKLRVNSDVEVRFPLPLHTINIEQLKKSDNKKLHRMGMLLGKPIPTNGYLNLTLE